MSSKRRRGVLIGVDSVLSRSWCKAVGKSSIVVLVETELTSILDKVAPLKTGHRTSPRKAKNWL